VKVKVMNILKRVVVSIMVFLHSIRIGHLNPNLSYIHDVTFRSFCSSGLSSFG
jgi:hypothetical protein